MEKITLITTIIYLAISILSFVLYFPRFKAFFGAFKPQQYFFNEKKNRFAIIVPARNESSVIEQMLKSVKAQNYDESLIDIYVIVKDTKDKTIEIAEKYDCHVQVCENQTRKGHALDYSFTEIVKNKPDYYDAFIIIDADSFIDKNFVFEMNNGLSTGAKVINGRRLQKNRMAKDGKGISLVADCSSIAYSFIDNLGSRYKSDNDITIGIIATGLLITNDYMKEMGGWKYHTLVEGTELKNDLAINDVKTLYCSRAIQYTEEAPTLKVTNQRRIRWTEGWFEVNEKYAKKIKEVSKSGNKRQKRNIAFATTMKYLFVFYVASFVFMNLQSLYLTIGMYKGLNWIPNFLLLHASNLLMYSLFFFFTLIALIVDGKDMGFSLKRRIALLFIAPFFFLDYMFITMKVILKKVFKRESKGWEEIKRESLLKYDI